MERLIGRPGFNFRRLDTSHTELFSTTVAVNDDVKLRQLSVGEVRVCQGMGMRWRKWPVGPRASIRYTSASGDGSGGQSPAAGRWIICGDC